MKRVDPAAEAAATKQTEAKGKPAEAGK